MNLFVLIKTTSLNENSSNEEFTKWINSDAFIEEISSEDVSITDNNQDGSMQEINKINSVFNPVILTIDGIYKPKEELAAALKRGDVSDIRKAVGVICGTTKRRPLLVFRPERKPQQQVQEVVQDEGPWTETALASYQDYYNYSGLNSEKGVQALFGAVVPAPEKVMVHEFRETPITALSPGNYCSKLTIIDFEKINIHFEFLEGVTPRTFNADAEYASRCGKVQVFSRYIMPEAEGINLIAGKDPKRLEEYLMRGSRCRRVGVEMTVSMHNDIANSPIKVILKNCKGSCSVKGISQEEAEKIFMISDRSNALEFDLESPDYDLEAPDYDHLPPK